MTCKPIFYAVISLFVGLFGSTQMSASDSLSLDLRSALQYAADHNLKIRSERLELLKANARIKEITGTGLPQISASVDFRDQLQLPVFVFPDPATGEQTPISVGTKYQSVGTLSVNQLIFDGTYFIGLKAAKEYKELTKRLLNQNERDLQVNVSKAYCLALVSQKNLELIEQNIETLRLTFAETQSLYHEGFVEALDVDRTRLSLSNLNAQKSKIEDAYHAAMMLFKFHAGIDLNTPVLLTEDLTLLFNSAYLSDQEFPSSDAHTETNRPEFKVMEQQIEMNALDVSRYKAQRYPTVRGFANYQEQFFGDRLNFDPWFTTSFWGLGVQVPIFSSGVNKNQIKQAAITLEQSKLDLAYGKELLRMERLNAQREFITSGKRADDRIKNYELAKEITQVTTAKYKLGVGSNLEVMNANQELKTAQTLYFEAMYELLIAKINLQVALGEPINLKPN